MRSALYYPHTKLHTENILKRSLLLWDKLEYIVAHKSYMPAYEDKRFARALELFGVPRHPTHEEKRKTHESIMDVFTRPNLPRSFYSHEGSSYPIYPDKFLPDTWDMLEELGVTTAQREASGREPLPEPAGLLLMSLLADTCAGETRARVTDRAAAYANITNLLTIDRDSVPRETISEDLVVPMTLDLINISDITLDELISFREREEKSGGGTLADLRHNYVDSIENYVSSLRQHSLSQADREELRRQFQSKMQDDLRDLCQELKLARTRLCSQARW